MIDTILLIAGLICFILAAVGATIPKVGLVPLGLAFWILTALIH